MRAHSPLIRTSSRSDWSAERNRLSEAISAARGTAADFVDFTVTNPTRVGFPIPHDAIAGAFARGAREPYEPDPRGILAARVAVARHLSSDGDEVSPDDLILTASTSEAYGFLFKVLGDPGDEILTPTPSYPLLDHLAALETLRLRRFRAEPGLRWELPAESAAEACGDRTKALVLIHPANPTGAFVSRRDQDALAALCTERRMPLVSDEVFLDFPLDGGDAAPAAASRNDVVAVSLGGLSKSAALPQMKLGWIRVGGPEREKRRLLDALELVADQWLSVGTPVQAAAAELLAATRPLAAAVRERCAWNLAELRRALAPRSEVSVPTVEGGWSAPIRVPALSGDDDLALELLAAGVLVQPGYFFDFDGDGWIVVSLLPPEPAFTEGARRLAAFFESRHR